MTDKIIKHNIFIYNAEADLEGNAIPIDVTKYVSDWTISNGGMENESAVDGIVVTGQMTINNDIDANFNPESEWGVVKTVIVPFQGDGTSSYAGVPSDIWVKSAAFNKIYDGAILEWDDLTTWDTYTSWNQTDGTTDNSAYYGNITISGSNFITPSNIPVGTLFEIIYTYTDYTERNPINTVDDLYSPLLDENAKIRIYSLTEDINWMEYYWISDGTNSFDNPTSGTPLVAGVGIMRTRTQGEWDDTTTWDAWTTWDQYDTAYDFQTEAYYDSNTNKIVLGAIPTNGKAITFSISYYEGTPEMIFSGYLGDSIDVDPENKTINLTFRDKGKLLQDTMIDGVSNVIDPSGWTIESKSDSDIFSISSVNATTGVFTTSAVHGLTTGDKIKFYQVDSLPIQSNGDKLTGTYTITVLSTTTFSLDGITLTGITTSISIRVQYAYQIGNLIRYKIYDKTATLDTTLNTLTFEIDRTDGWIQFVLYDEDQSLIFLDGATQKEFKKGSNFLPLSTKYIPTVSVGSNETISLEKDFEAITTSTNSLATGRNAKDFDEKGVATSSISTSTDTLTFAVDHLLTTGDIVSLTSTLTLPQDASGVLNQYYEVGVVDDTNIKLYTRDSFGELQLVDITNAGTGTITVISTQFRVGDVIRNILEDLETVQGINYIDNIESDFNTNVGLNTDIWNMKTVWDTLQTLASMKALYIAYLWDEPSQDFVLTISNLPAKTSADFTLESNEMYLQTQNITGADIRNFIYVNYYDTSGTVTNPDTITAQDATSIARYGNRPSVITEGKTSPINSPVLAEQLAAAILANSKDRVIESIATIPFQFKYGSNRINIGNTVGLTYKYLDYTYTDGSWTVPYYAIESIEHSYSAGKYQTRLRGNKQKVRTSVRRYLQQEARPGAFRQQIGRDLSELYQIPAVTDISVTESGLETESLDPRAYAIISFKRPDNYYPLYYTLQITKDGDSYADGEEYKIDNVETAYVTQRINFDPNFDYDFKIIAWSKAGIKGVESAETTLSEVEDKNVKVIRTQAQLDNFYTNLPTSSSTESDYKTLKMYAKATNYTITSGTAARYFNSEKIEIIGVGDVKIDIDGNDTSYPTFNIKCDKFTLNNIDIETSFTATGAFGVFSLEKKTTGVKTVIDIRNCEVEGNDVSGTYTRFVSAGYMENTNVFISDNVSRDARFFNMTQSTVGGEDKMQVLNNSFRFDTTFETAINLVNNASGILKNLYFTNNYFFNCKIRMRRAENVFVNQNTFENDQDTSLGYIDNFFAATGTSKVINKMQVNNNNVNYTKTSGTQNTYFIYSVSGTIGGLMIIGNRYTDDGSGTFDWYGGGGTFSNVTRANNDPT